jgi:hypothetical protein
MVIFDHWSYMTLSNGFLCVIKMNYGKKMVNQLLRDSHTQIDFL